MPPKGLYAIPRHHLYNRNAIHRKFNSNELKPQELLQVEETATPLPQQNDKAEYGTDLVSRKEKKSKKNSRRESVCESKDGEELDGTGKTNKSKHRKHRKSRASGVEDQHALTNQGIAQRVEISFTPYGVRPSEKLSESNSKGADGEKNASLSSKKRKRLSKETNMDHEGAAGNSSDARQLNRKRRSISDGKRDNFHEKRKNRKNLGVKMLNYSTPNDIRDIEHSELAPHDPQGKKGKDDKDASVQTRTTGADVYVNRLSKKTPIPLPNSASSTHLASGLPPRLSLKIQERRGQNKTRSTPNNMAPSSDILVSDTPTQVNVERNAITTRIKTPIPFPPLQTTPRSDIVKQVRRESVREASTPQKEQQQSGKPSNQKRTTKITRPLSDEPKPRPRSSRSHRASSSGASSRASSVSIPEMFQRIKLQSGSLEDPSKRDIQPTQKIKSSKHQEAKMAEFNEKFLRLQKTMNFAHEREYLDQYFDWIISNKSEYALPCLSLGSGCNAKKEEIIRLAKLENLDTEMLNKEVGSRSVIEDANDKTLQAEQFLMLAIQACVPIPLGRIDGQWTLYCPKYAEDHFDRYGCGRRTISISSILGFKDKTYFTARINLPPLQRVCSLKTFSVPPHASFRSTTLHTVEENYKLDIIFLGNGYLQMRVDLGLLLRGKPTEAVNGKVVYMEFIGVHEKAMNWMAIKDEVMDENNERGLCNS
ncbi:hypothetical protein B0J11DRAFT_577300 [Dendryphion nanum]|uniref:Uncharacterized protein n=1 Tax=Dendryphion nanum TaxID=256645 RepID=A0A9P9IVK4_9PLEO|nr:hypothetical protein B0J11DRAFT_577300 [Dendryphion nanum]